MGVILGILAKREDNLINQSPIYVNEDNMLSDYFISLDKSFNKFLDSWELDQDSRDWFNLTADEIKSLNYNIVMEQDMIDYFINSGQPFPENSYHLDMKYSGRDLVYSDRFKQYENWADTYVIRNALSKFSGGLFIKLKNEILNHLDFRTTERDYINCLFLGNIIDTYTQLSKVDKIALIQAVY